MSDPLAQTPDEIADRAVAAGSEAFDSVKAFTTGIASDQMPAFGPNLVYGLPDDVQAEILGSTD